MEVGQLSTFEFVVLCVGAVSLLIALGIVAWAMFGDPERHRHRRIVLVTPQPNPVIDALNELGVEVEREVFAREHPLAPALDTLSPRTLANLLGRSHG